MSFRETIRDYLGINDIRDRQEIHSHAISDAVMTLRLMKVRVGLTTDALGKILAKLEPMLAAPEHDPGPKGDPALKTLYDVRKADSDAIGEAVIKRLIAEQAARDHTEGKL